MLDSEMHEAIGEMTVAGAQLENMTALTLTWARGRTTSGSEGSSARQGSGPGSCPH